MAEPTDAAQCVPLAPAGFVELAATGEVDVARLGVALGAELPVAPNTTSRGGDARAYWLAPSRWLLRTAAGAEAALLSRLDAVAGDCAGSAHLAVVVSDAYAGFAITGERAADALAEACPLDLSTLADARVPRCARTVLARVPVLLAPLDRAPGFEVWVDSAYAGYLGDWLAGAATRARA